MTRSVDVLQGLLLNANTNNTELREGKRQRSEEEIKELELAGEEGGEGRGRREASWGRGEKEKDATLQDIRRLRETLLSLSRSLGDFAEVLDAPNVSQLLS